MADVVSVGKALWEAAIDRSKIPSDAAAVNADIAAAGAKGEQAATASATSTLAKVKGLSRAAASTVALGAGAMFGVATKLASEGEDAMAKFQAQTGATRQEAEDALASMNRLAGQNLQSFGTVSDALTQVTTNMGLTGKAAEDATNLILKFSTATGTDAVQNVSAFDDVLDSWGKTAADLPGIMDQIVASTQKYGGTVGEATSALKDMAPALRAMGMSVDDGIALLDVFRASGVDAAGATAGLNKALKNLKPGQDLNDLVAQIGAIEDPTLRSQKAIELFGKSGAKLGNAIQPGMTSLDDFKVSMQDAQGATTDAANAIEGTLPNQIKLAVSGALAQARGFATDFGPALMGGASFVSIGTSIASALKLDDALKGAWTKAASSSAVTSAVSTAGKMMGGSLGLAVGIGFAAILSGVLVTTWMQALVDANNKIINDPNAVTPLTGVAGRMTVEASALLKARKAAQTLGQAALDAFNQTFAAAQGRGESWQDALVGANAAAGLSQRLQHMWSSVAPAAKKAAFDGGVSGGGSWATGFSQTVLGGTTSGWWNRTLGPLFEHDTSFAKAGAKAGDDFLHGVQDVKYPANVMDKLDPVPQLAQQVADEAPQVSDALTHMWSSVPSAPSRQLGVHFGQQFVVGFKSTQDSAKSEWQQYLDDLAHPNRGRRTVGWIVGKLTGEDLAKGLASSDPIVRHSAEQTQQDLRVQLQGMLDDGYTIGHKTLEKLGLGIVNGKLVAINAAKGAKTGVNDALNNTSGVYGYGEDLVNRWAAGMAHAGINAATIAEGVVHRVGGVFLDDVPIRPDAPEHIKRIGEYGQHFLQRWVGGMWSQGDAAARSAGLLGARIAGSLNGMGFGPLQQLTGGGAVVRHEGTVEVRLSRDTIAAARSQGASWEDIGRMGRSANAFVSGMQMRLGVNG